MTIPIGKELAEIGQDMPRDNRAPNPDEVICPGCGHQFRAIPQNVQEELAAAKEIHALASAPPGHVVVSEAFKREAGLAAYFWNNGNHERFCGAMFRLIYAIEGRTPEGALPSARKPK